MYLSGGLRLLLGSVRRLIHGEADPEQDVSLWWVETSSRRPFTKLLCLLVSTLVVTHKIFFQYLNRLYDIKTENP